MPMVGKARQRRISKAIFPRKRDAAKSTMFPEESLGAPRFVIPKKGNLETPQSCNHKNFLVAPTPPTDAP